MLMTNKAKQQSVLIEFSAQCSVDLPI